MLASLSVTNFRCISAASIALDETCSLIEGPNGSGKTSLLESIYCLSRGRSFRSARRDHAIRYGESALTLVGEVAREGRKDRLGLEISRGGRRIRINGQDADRLGELARLLPVQLIDPAVHELVDGGPEGRRRYMDFGVFHVEPRFLKTWSDYRRALSQRNSALRADAKNSELDVWDKALSDLADGLVVQRQVHIDALSLRLPAVLEALFPETPVVIEHRQGWDQGKDLLEVLAADRDRDRQTGITQHGAHRADLKVVFRDRMARHQVSRGQEKLLASALILAQIGEIQSVTGIAPVLLLDDPAAELDTESLSRLLQAVFAVPCQRVITALDATRIRLPVEPALFHVKQGAFTGAGTR